MGVIHSLSLSLSLYIYIYISLRLMSVFMEDDVSGVQSVKKCVSNWDCMDEGGGSSHN